MRARERTQTLDTDAPQTTARPVHTIRTHRFKLCWFIVSSLRVVFVFALNRVDYYFFFGYLVFASLPAGFKILLDSFADFAYLNAKLVWSHFDFIVSALC